QMLSALWLIHRILEIRERPLEPRVPRVFIYAGKAAPGYRQAKSILQLITALAEITAEDPVVQDQLRILFLEGYDVSLAERIIPAADLSEQIPCPGYEASGTGNMKFAMNGALTIASRDGANLDLEAQISSTWWPFAFGHTLEEIQLKQRDPSYNPRDLVRTDPRLQRALDALMSGTFARYSAEQEVFKELCQPLLEPLAHRPADPYFVLGDFAAYVDAQKRVEAIFQDPLQWHRMALMNIAGTGSFSIDRTIQDYNREVWQLQPVPIDPKILEEVTTGWTDAGPENRDIHSHS
ncbi:MAG: glycogen/starch/alpha-glucan phosphorylase, partial [Chlamydiia bacterium]